MWLGVLLTAFSGNGNYYSFRMVYSSLGRLAAHFEMPLLCYVVIFVRARTYATLHSSMDSLAISQPIVRGYARYFETLGMT